MTARTIATRAAAGVPKAARLRRGQWWGARSSLLMLPLLAYFLLPLFWLVVASTKSSTDLFNTFGLWFSGHVNLVENVRQLFHYDHGIFARWLANTAIYSVTSAVGAAALATAGGYALGKFKFRGANLTFALILGSIMVPSTALVIPTYLLFSRIGLIDTAWAVILPSLVNPFGLYLMRVYAETSIPDEMLEAARVDGAGEIRTLVQVAMPLLTPGFVTVLLFSFVATWNNYFLPLVVLSNPKLYPVTVGLANMNAMANAGSGAQVLFPLVIVGALVAIIPLIAAFLALQRYWRSGLALGSIR